MLKLHFKEDGEISPKIDDSLFFTRLIEVNSMSNLKLLFDYGLVSKIDIIFLNKFIFLFNEKDKSINGFVITPKINSVECRLFKKTLVDKNIMEILMKNAVYLCYKTKHVICNFDPIYSNEGVKNE